MLRGAGSTPERAGGASMSALSAGESLDISSDAGYRWEMYNSGTQALSHHDFTIFAA
jgi:hypothetical protein